MFACFTAHKREMKELRELMQSVNAENVRTKATLEQKCSEVAEARASMDRERAGWDRERTGLFDKLLEEQVLKNNAQKEQKDTAETLAIVRKQLADEQEKAKKAQHGADKYKAHAKKLHNEVQRTRRENEDLENRLDRMQSALEMLEGVLDELSVEPQLRQSMSKKGLAGLRQSKQNITELIRESKVMKAALRASQIISLPPPVEMDEQGTGDTGAPVSSDQVILA